MKITETKLKGAFIIEISKLEDERGFFARYFCSQVMKEHGLKTEIIQANTSYTLKKGSLRGMHFQLPPHEETKLVRCVRGAIYDVIIDLRLESPTFKQWIGVVLNANNFKMLYVPEGFAHGFLTLTDDVEVLYKVSAFYNPEAERGVRWDDKTLGIEWPFKPGVISDRDSKHPDFSMEMFNLINS